VTDSGKRTPTGGKFSADEVDALLETGGGLPLDVGEPKDADASRWIGTRVGPFRIDEFVASGGMARVFRGERADGQYEQQVAIKILRAAPGEPISSRLPQERELLARLDHPGIARIIDSGTVDNRPWLAMEHVEGEHIDRYCDTRQLAIGDRLALFIQVARAVQFAHRKLIVHRDLKPSNVLVDASGHAKLLDFGIARLLQEDCDPSKTQAELLLTPQYASPEQVLGEPTGVASDVYQLGLLFYKLLTGSDAHRFDQVSIATIKSIVVDEPTPQPSTRVATANAHDADHARKLARARSTSVTRLQSALHGDLDIIAGKCLSKEPDERYATVQELLDDLTAFQALRPIAARAPSRLYRARRFVQRNRGGVLSSVLTLIVLIGAATALGISWRATIEAQQRALQEAEATRQVGDFLAGLLAEGNPQLTGGEARTVREVLDQAVVDISELSSQPRVQARLLEVIADAYVELSLMNQAETLLHRVTDLYEQLEEPTLLAQPAARLGYVMMRLGKLDEALERGLAATALAESSVKDPQIRGLIHLSLSHIYFQRGEYELQREQLELARTLHSESNDPNADNDLATVLENLAAHSKQVGEYDRALNEVTTAIELMGDDPSMRVSRMFALELKGTLHSTMADERLAVETLRQSVALGRQVYGENGSAFMLGPLVLLGRSLLNQSRIDDAEPILLEAIDIAEATIGTDHGNYARVLHEYAAVQRLRGKYDELRALRREASNTAASFFGEDHSTAVNLRKAEAYIDLDAGLYREGVAAIDAILPTVRSTFGDAHMITFTTSVFRSRAMLEVGRVVEATAAMRTLEQSGRNILDGKFRAYEWNLTNLARATWLTGDFAAAREYADRAVALHRELGGDAELAMIAPLTARLQPQEPPTTGKVALADEALDILTRYASPASVDDNARLSALAVQLARLGYGREAGDYCAKALQRLAGLLPADQARLAYARRDCALAAIYREQPDAAAGLLDAAIPVIETALGEDNWQTLWTRRMRAELSGDAELSAQLGERLVVALGPDTPLLSMP